MIPTKELLKMRAYHSKPELKNDLVEEIKNHMRQDRIIKGTYGEGYSDENFRGCAVGCSIHSLNVRYGKKLCTSSHNLFETELGIPESLARLEDYLFEAMPNDKAMKFPLEFAKAVSVGANLSKVAPKFISETLRDVVKLKYVKGDKAVVKAILETAKLWDIVVSGKTVKAAAWSAAWSAARSAARSAAWSAARSAAWSAARSAAWSTAESAARSAAWSAAESAAWSAAESAAAYKMSRKLLKIIKSCK